jgi:hypothetical protein
MTTDFQTIAALVVVAITAAWMIARALSKRRKPGCGGGCACPSQEKNWKKREESADSGRIGRRWKTLR